MLPPQSSQRLESLQADGFTTFDALICADAVTALRAIYDRILSRELAAEGDRWLGEVTRQVMFPSRAHELFRCNEALDATRAIARGVFDGAEPFFSYDQLLYKPPGHPAETPWHQDMAYARMPFSPPGYPCRDIRILQFWIALDAVDAENGCMHFIAGRHLQPLLEHRVVSGRSDDQSRLLGIVRPAEVLDLAQAIACPLSAGGATLHLAGTPHFTPANRSKDRPRRAYIINYLHPALAPRG